MTTIQRFKRFNPTKDVSANLTQTVGGWVWWRVAAIICKFSFIDAGGCVTPTVCVFDNANNRQLYAQAMGANFGSDFYVQWAVNQPLAPAPLRFADADEMPLVWQAPLPDIIHNFDGRVFIAEENGLCNLSECWITIEGQMQGET